MAPEGRVGLARGHRLNNLVELAEPRHHQVAVGEQHPVAIDDAAHRSMRLSEAPVVSRDFGGTTNFFNRSLPRSTKQYYVVNICTRLRILSREWPHLL